MFQGNRMGCSTFTHEQTMEFRILCEFFRLSGFLAKIGEDVSEVGVAYPFFRVGIEQLIRNILVPGQ